MPALLPIKKFCIILISCENTLQNTLEPRDNDGLMMGRPHLKSESHAKTQKMGRKRKGGHWASIMRPHGMNAFLHFTVAFLFDWHAEEGPSPG